MISEEHDWFWHGPEPPMHIPARSWRKSPYEHECHLADAAGCDPDDCPACRWTMLRELKEREDLGKPPRSVVLTAADIKLLKAAKISWHGDLRSVN